VNITNNTPTSNNIENARSSYALNHVKLTTQIFCISFLTTIFTLFCASNSLAQGSNHNNSPANSVNGKISHKCANELSNERIFNNDIVIGNRDAKVILIEYFAPTCTHCSEYHLKVFPELKRKYIDTGKIAYVMRGCVGNKQDFDASLLARCKGDIDSYQKLTSHLLHTQNTWAYSKDYRANLYKVANDYGISNAQYDLCLNDDIKSKTLFDHAKLLAADDDFIGTPSFYINGKLFKAEYSQSGLSDAIEDELTKE
jgi:hypothetical protein